MVNKYNKKGQSYLLVLTWTWFIHSSHTNWGNPTNRNIYPHLPNSLVSTDIKISMHVCCGILGPNFKIRVYGNVGNSQ